MSSNQVWAIKCEARVERLFWHKEDAIHFLPTMRFVKKVEDVGAVPNTIFDIHVDAGVNAQIYRYEIIPMFIN